MREIKFRAWDKEKKKWIRPYPEAFHIIGEVTVFDLLKQYSIKDFNNVIIMQYTGLKDKNGKELYENDVLKWSDGYKQNEYIQQVIFDNGSFTSADPRDSGGATTLRCEIIGNIYENPELLK